MRPNPDEGSHAASVEAWLHRGTKGSTGPTTAELISLLERALGALWQRAEVTRGQVTIAAIVDRVIYTAAEKYPFLSPLKIEHSGITCDGLRAQRHAHDSEI